MARGPQLTAADVGRCPHRVALDRGAPTAFAPEPRAVEIVRRIREADDHRDATFARLRELHPDAVDAGSLEATTAAINERRDVILHARLVETGAHQRTSAVDVLVRASRHDATSGYVPMIIKNNEVVEHASTRRLLESSLEALGPDKAVWTSGIGVRRNDTMTRNGISLAHATRILEANGVGDPTHFAAVIDRGQRVWWFDLDSDDWGRWKLANYDEAFNEREEIIERHTQWRNGDGPFPTSPFWHRECPACPYRTLCESELEVHDDVSLVRFTSLDQQIFLRDNGIATRRQLAALNPDRARQSRAKALSPEGSHEVEDRLGRKIDKLDELIYRARSVVQGSPLLIVDADDVNCPTADVEIDVDMESYNELTYLWGAYVTTRRTIFGIKEGYHSFVSFEPLDGDVEMDVFANFWRWFSDTRSLARAADASFAAYCFWAHAEESAMNRAVRHGLWNAPTRDEIDRFRRGDPNEWIDLHEVVKRQIQTDGPLGLKSLAKYSGFEWRDDNPSGEASMIWYEDAISADPDVARRARERLLEYNEDDCRATLSLRQWLNGPAHELPSRDDIP